MTAKAVNRLIRNEFGLFMMFVLLSWLRFLRAWRLSGSNC
jgi:hypothetical protein